MPKVSFTSNFESVVKEMDRKKGRFLSSVVRGFQEIAKEAFVFQANNYFINSKSLRYQPQAEADIPKTLPSGKLSKKNFFFSSKIISRTGELRDNILNAADDCLMSTKCANDDIGFEITKSGISITAESDKFGRLERAKSAKGNKQARNTTVKTWRRVITRWKKTMDKILKGKL